MTMELCSRRLIRAFTLSIVLFVAMGQARASAQTSQITYPANGATGADLSLPIQWTSVPSVQTYYLYVGTTVGAKNVVDTGETPTTSYLASNVPLGQTLYARLWTKVAGVWRYADSTFNAGTTVSRSATLTHPANGAVNADLSQPIRWTSVPNAQAYYLYVGTSVGAKNLVDTGETLATAYLPLSLPAGQTLYARLWTRTGGVWNYVDSTFSAAPAVVARLTYPATAATNADLTQPIQWTAISGVQAYYLYVGTSLGLKELVDTGETLQTSYLARNLPSGQTLYARLWTRVGGVWRYADSTFTAAPVLTATMTYPVNGATSVDVTQPFRWTSVANVQAYTLYIGTALGAHDLLSTGEISQPSYGTVPSLPAAQTLYVRLWTRVGGVWRWVDSTFTAAPILTARLTFPANGAVNADLTNPVQWTSVANAQTYYLYLGTTLGAKDLLDSAETHQTSLTAPALPPGQVAFARLWTKVGGVWRFTDSTFVPLPLKARLTYPADRSLVVVTPFTFQWTPRAGAQAYYLYVGTTAGAHDVVDTGEIQGTSYFRAGLPSVRTLYVKLWTKLGGVWQSSDSTFTIVPSAFLVQAADLHYQGAFRLPPDDFGSPQFHGFNYGGSAIAFNSQHDSLYMVGHSQDQLVAEISVPDIRTGTLYSLATAGVLQNFFDPLEGRRNDVNPLDPNSKLLGGLLPLADRIVITAYSYYDGLGTQVGSHFVRPTALTTSGAVQGPFQVGTLAGMVSGYMTMVPVGWQQALGGPVLTGNCCLGVISRTSYGPAVSSIHPADVGVVNPVPAVPLVQYGSSHTTLGAWDGANPLFNGTTQITGVVFPEDTGSVLFFGRRGLGTFCYGPGTADTMLAGRLADGGIDRYCFDPADSSKGTHAFPYVYSVWAYSALDLAAVHAGAKQPWEPVPYAVWNLNLPYATGGGLLLGAAYDPVRNRIFVSQAFGDGTLPVVHVFTVPRN
jgi:hypothetical protein